MRYCQTSPPFACPFVYSNAQYPPHVFLGVNYAAWHRTSKPPLRTMLPKTHHFYGVSRSCLVPPFLLARRRTAAHQRAPLAMAFKFQNHLPRQALAPTLSVLAATDGSQCPASDRGARYRVFYRAARLAPRPLSDAATQKVRVLVLRRRQVSAMLTAERNHLGTVPPHIQEGDEPAAYRLARRPTDRPPRCLDVRYRAQRHVAAQNRSVAEHTRCRDCTVAHEAGPGAGMGHTGPYSGGSPYAFTGVLMVRERASPAIVLKPSCR